MKRVLSILLLTLVLSGLLVTGCAAPAPAPAPASATQKPAPTAEWDRVVADAKKEGSVVVYGSFVDQTQTFMRDYFAKNYGIKFEFMLTTGSAGLTKVQAEQASKNYICDVLSVPTSTIRIARKEGLLEDFVPPELLSTTAKWAIADPLAEKPFYIWGITPSGITFNTNLIPAGTEPKSHKDLLDPKWKGKFIIDDVRALGKSNVLFNYMYNLYGEDYLRKLLVDNAVVMGRKPQEQAGMVARGEYYGELSSTFKLYNGVVSQQSTAPLGFRYYEEGSCASLNSVAAIKNAPHPNAAKLFVNYLFSAEGQSTAVAQGEVICPVRLGVKVPNPERQDLAKIKMLQPFPPPPEFETEQALKMVEIAKKLLP